MDISTILGHVKSIDFFKEQNIVGKDLNDLCELLTYQKFEAGETVYEF
jgi:hypothetical protein